MPGEKRKVLVEFTIDANMTDDELTAALKTQLDDSAATDNFTFFVVEAPVEAKKGKGK